MSRNLLALPLAATLLAGPALADVPAVAADIAPVHSLVARVMAGIGAPALIVAPGASPHEYSLRPSEATALQQADVVFWTGPDLTPWMEGAIGSLATGAAVVPLMEAPGTATLDMREGAVFEPHAHDDHAGHHGHAQDPHAWLSPDNGAAWLDAIAATLGAADPENAGAYRANAAAGRAELAALKAEIDGILRPVRGGSFIVFHDAYQYFERAFDMPASGAISVSSAADPSPARIADIQRRVRERNARCVLSEPQFNPGIIASVMDGSDARSGVLDPLGASLEPGPELYPQMLRDMAAALAACL
ncbi:zinc transporter [Pelagivirga sediminicola]|uniref:High-affinity zinc uptake system protein ZnuA n=1 Tax=Pelagivirga sediminicola TaxID=2170575 RepID=A0A2T7G414_9RHOB|nr:zinc ABC transporter substrate-binding protein [Pelagivirga sediminicola]PVA09147.1 zinc transporter [Pelagivirga sediminicola]